MSFMILKPQGTSAEPADDGSTRTDERRLSGLVAEPDSRLRVSRSAAFFLSGATLLSLLVRLSIGPMRWSMVALLFTGAALFALYGWLLGRRLPVRVGGVAIMTTYVILVFAAAWFGAGPFSPVIPFLAIAPLLSVFLISSSAGAVTAGVVVGGQLVFLLLQDRLPSSLIEPSPWSYFAMLSVAVLMSTYVAGRHEAENERLRDQLHRQARSDWLTQLVNRRVFDEVLAREANRTIRYGTSLSVLLVDVDDFKKFNDHYGHQKGDACLISVADTLRRCFRRKLDTVARIGGEEFAILLPAADPEHVQRLAEEAREAVAALRIPHVRSPWDVITISIGVVTADAAGAREVMREADKALYRAKAQGKNQVAVAFASGAVEYDSRTSDDEKAPN